MKKTYKLMNLDCANCARKMEEAIKKLHHVEDAQVSFLTQKLTLTAAEESFDETLKEVVKACKRVEPDCEIKIG